mmetsp:Transcript_12782/g.40784  ORF Transcript_12782/g.40784 Transcript_12782/m.40784 type:complete len:282 (+) Transcript_12782:133-978(+)
MRPGVPRRLLCAAEQAYSPGGAGQGVSRPHLSGLLAGLAANEIGPTLIAGDARGSDSVIHACIDGHSTEAALSAPSGVETVAADLPSACGANRDMLGVPTDIQLKVYTRGCPGGPHMTCSAFHGCRGGGDCAGEMVIDASSLLFLHPCPHGVQRAAAALAADQDEESGRPQPRHVSYRTRPSDRAPRERRRRGDRRVRWNSPSTTLPPRLKASRSTYSASMAPSRRLSSTSREATRSSCACRTTTRCMRTRSTGTGSRWRARPRWMASPASLSSAYYPFIT